MKHTDDPNESLPTIAIIGGGPIGLEAALYARFLGYDTSVFERGELAEQVAKWGEQPLDASFGDLSSPLGRAALQAQNGNGELPPCDSNMSGTLWLSGYLLPLAASDLLRGRVHTQTEIVGVHRTPSQPCDSETNDAESDGPSQFQLSARDENGNLNVFTADIVIDASGRPANCPEGTNDFHAKVLAAGIRIRIPSDLPPARAESDAFGQREALANHLTQEEPNYYLLGVRSIPSPASFRVSTGLQQIQAIFTLIGNRRDLDLYQTFG